MPPAAKRNSSPRKKARSGKDKTKDRAKDKTRDKTKGRKSRDKPSSASAQPPAPQVPAAVATPTPPPVAAPTDPDAVQLFRRYDRSRTGVLTRLDFLELVRDYAKPPASSHGGYSRRAARAPLSLTDSSGIPLGFARTDHNSEFEAGQLFERYDADRSGALTLAKFLPFFADFRPQLTAFAEDCAYENVAVGSTAPVAPAVMPSPSPGQKEEEATAAAAAAGRSPSLDHVKPTEKYAVTNAATVDDDLDATRRRYKAALWELHKLCKDELESQRQRILEQMEAIRNDVAQRQRSRSVPAKRTRAVRFRDLTNPHSVPTDDGESNRTSEQYEVLEGDLDHIDEIMRFVRQHLRRGSPVPLREMQSFLAQAATVQEEAQYLAMKDIGDVVPSRRLPTQPPDKRSNSARSSPDTAESDNEQEGQQGRGRLDELQDLLRVKDEMIYQLLQERSALRREKAAAESYLKTLSNVTSQEMKKWAQLTDDMQDEIERLRSQLPTRRSTSR